MAHAGWLGQAPILTVSKRTAEALTRAGSRDVAMVHYREPSLVWYAQLHELRCREAEQAVLASDQFDVAICIAEQWSALPADIRQRWQVLSTVHGRLYNERMRSDVVLVLRRIPSVDVNMTE